MAARFLTITSLIVLMVAGGGCTFARDRLNDFADVFTARVGICYGVSARAQVTDYFSVGVGGAAGKKYGFIGRDLVGRRETYYGFPVSNIFFAVENSSDAPACFALPLPSERIEVTNYPRTTLKAGYEKDIYRALAIRFFDKQRHLFPSDMRVEVGLTAVIIGLDLGFNPVELADFFAGFFGADFAKDDSFYWDDFDRLVRLVRTGDSFHRAVATSRIIELGAVEGTEEIFKLLDSTNGDTVLAALDILGELKAETVLARLKARLFKFTTDRQRSAALGAVVKIQDTDVVPYVHTVLSKCALEDRLLAEHCFAVLWGENAGSTPDFLLDLLKRKKWNFLYFDEALRYVSALRLESSRAPLLDLLEASRSGKTPQEGAFFASTSRALGQLGETQAADILIRSLTNDSFKPHWGTIAVALGHIGSRDALPLVERRIGQSPAGSPERFPMLLSHFLIESKLYAAELTGDILASDHVTTPGTSSYFTELDARISLVETGRVEIMDQLLAYLEKARDANMEHNYYKFEYYLARIENAFYGMAAHPRPESYGDFRKRLKNIIEFIVARRGSFTWNAERGQVVPAK